MESICPIMTFPGPRFAPVSGQLPAVAALCHLGTLPFRSLLPQTRGITAAFENAHAKQRVKPKLPSVHNKTSSLAEFD